MNEILAFRQRLAARRAPTARPFSLSRIAYEVYNTITNFAVDATGVFYVVANSDGVGQPSPLFHISR